VSLTNITAASTGAFFRIFFGQFLVIYFGICVASPVSRRIFIIYCASRAILNTGDALFAVLPVLRLIVCCFNIIYRAYFLTDTPAGTIAGDRKILIRI
jgi:hypothetical protein